MKTSNGAIVALLLLATCSDEVQDPDSFGVESAERALGQVPATESAVWQKVGSSTTPDGRYLQAVAFDSTRETAVMFGGTNINQSTGLATPNQETWEWSVESGKWSNRTGAGSAPEARSGAAMVYDSKRAKFVLFGGRAGSGYNYEDTWEWDPVTGQWTDMTNAGAHPTARSQHGMVYEASTGMILLYGGGRSDSDSWDASGVSMSLGDTWELDPTTYVWTPVTTPIAPTARHDFGLVWDSAHNKAVLFGGMQTDVSGVTGVPKQDTWEWDPSTAAWMERTGSGNKPGPRYGHAMAFDGSRGKVVVFGGFAISTGGSLNDVWEWDPTTGAWTPRMNGSEAPMPGPRRYASLVSDDARGRLDLIAGATNYDPYGSGGTGGIIIMPPGMYGIVGSREVWELDPVAPAFTDRTDPLDVPAPRTGHAMAFNPSTGGVYLFGGLDQMTGRLFDDLWLWDGTTWTQMGGNVRPPARSDAGLAYDPVRQSLILYGGSSNNGGNDDTWEWTLANGWTQLFPSTSPDPLFGHGMVTDTTHNKILLFAGISYPYWKGGPYRDPVRNEVWEWDGATLTWTNRTPTASSGVPSPRQYPIMAYDEGRKKLFVYDGSNYGYSMGLYWEWDPVSAGWAMYDTGDNTEFGYAAQAAYDSIRRREVLLVQGYDPRTGFANDETWELDANRETLYVRSISSPLRYGAQMASDSARGVVVLFGGQTWDTGAMTNETWEYRVTGLGNGEGCTADSAASCASGFCVDGVCCETGACEGPCQSCNVRGSEGTCAPVKAGTQVPGSCSDGQACDGNGNCMAANGQQCTSAASCASGFCADGVCCDAPCAATCMACDQTGFVGQCTPFAAGTDPQNECGQGVGVCMSKCDGVGNCAFPQSNVSCGDCLTCDGFGKCSIRDPYCFNTGGSGGSPFGTGGYPYPTGGVGGRTTGTGGYPYPSGGIGGYVRGGSGGTVIGSGGYPYPSGGAGGRTTGPGGSGGSTNRDGSADATSRGGSGGFDASGDTMARGGSGGSDGGTGDVGNFGGAGGMTAGLGGASGSTVPSGGAIGQGGSTLAAGGAGGKADAGFPIDGTGGKRDAGIRIDAVTNARLHGSGCSCVLGRAAPAGSPLSVSFFAVAVGLLLARSRRRKR
jgi:hypothetical protein